MNVHNYMTTRTQVPFLKAATILIWTFLFATYMIDDRKNVTRSDWKAKYFKKHLGGVTKSNWIYIIANKELLQNTHKRRGFYYNT